MLSLTEANVDWEVVVRCEKEYRVPTFCQRAAHVSSLVVFLIMLPAC